ncbi:MAG: metal-dependent hydrolase [Desulfitobacteriia bacterium]|jgi:L-ascorbate metabolism protein UlaG (beta-lactamase superfamily)
MKVRYHGHACFELETSTGRIIIDPFLCGNPTADVTPVDFSKLDAILISHGHSDHFGDAIELAQKTGAVIVSNFELASFAEKFGVNVHQMHIGGKYQFPFATIKLTQALHGSGIPKGDGTFHYGGLACGFLIQAEGKWLYHAGDTGLFGDMELIGRQYNLELAMLPIGDNFVMGPEDAILAAQMLRAKSVIPMHYNTFPVIKQDGQAFINELQRQVPECRGILLQAGQVLEI